MLKFHANRWKNMNFLCHPAMRMLHGGIAR